MHYEIEFKPRAVKDLKLLAGPIQRRLLARIESLRNDLADDVRRLADFTFEYHLRVGGYRVLFEVERSLPDRALQGCVRLNGSATMKLHPEILVKNGKKEFVVLPYEEFLALQERLADAEDLLTLRKDKRVEAKNKSVPLSEVKRTLGARQASRAMGMDQLLGDTPYGPCSQGGRK